jgi:hypothetical protein
MGKTTRSCHSGRKPKRSRNPKPGDRSQRLSHRHRKAPQGICRADAPKTGFGDLPAELRNHIYEIALKPSLHRSVRIIQEPQGQRIRYDLALGLLCTCKGVRQEAWPFLYEKNDFRIDCVKPPPRPTVPCSEDLHPNDNGVTMYGGTLYLNFAVIYYEIC